MTLNLFFSVLRISIVMIFVSCRLVVADDRHYSFLHINTEHGLVNNQTNTILKDSRGFTWIGTSAGLSRFDGVGFKNYIHNNRDSSSLIDNLIVDLQEMEGGNILIETRQTYTIFDIGQESFISIESFLESIGIQQLPTKLYVDKNKRLWFKMSEQSSYLTLDSQGKLVDLLRNGDHDDQVETDFFHDGKNYYFIYSKGTIECYSGLSLKLQFRYDFLQKRLGVDSLNNIIFVDRSSDIWVYGNAAGIYYFNSANKKWRHFTARPEANSLSSNLVKSVTQDKEGIIWIGTDHGGVDLYDKKSGTFKTLLHHADDPKSLAQNSITDLFVDDLGIVWISTYKSGVSYYHQNIHKFPHFHHITSDKRSLPFDDVNCFVEDDHGNIWIGTNGGGLIYFDRKQNNHRVYKHDPKNKNSLSNDVVVSLFIDNAGLLWIGTFTGGLNTFDGSKFTRFLFKKDAVNSLPSNNIWTIAQDSKGRIWIGTLGGGIVLYDKNTRQFTKVPNHGSIQFGSLFANQFRIMRNGNIFIGSAEGILFYDMSQEQYQYHPFYEKESNYEIINNNVYDVYEDTRGLLWIATGEGLSVINPLSDYVKNFEIADGLSEVIMNCILEDESNDIWVSKSNGLCRIKVKDENSEMGYAFSVTNFTGYDGLQGEEFNVNARLLTKEGELIFGGPNGFNLFRPEEIKFDQSIPNVVFTDFQIFNKSVNVDEKLNGKVLLKQSISATDMIEIRHSMNVFSIEFAALNYLRSDRVQFKYMLDGFDQDWISTSENTRRVTYTNLNEGEYVFKVKASSNDGLWRNGNSELKIVILPPFYRSGLAYFIYAVAFIAAMLIYRYSTLRKERMKFKNEQEKQQVKRNLEMDEMKLKFLTNVSHEFRTPLSLILSPLEKLMKRKRNSEDHHLLEIMNRNARQLLDLVNQLLDFRKLDLHGLKYNPSYGDLVGFARGVCENFIDSFKKKKIQYHFESNVEVLFMQFDHEKLQKVIMNLISNALKFTMPNGQIIVKISREEGIDEYVLFKVKDSGIGIPGQEKEKIFERFYQSSKNQSMGISGSGIGLNLVREMVQLHNGTIWVESEEGKGSEFIVKIPVFESVENIQPEVIDTPALIESELDYVEEEHDLDRSILLVEDNADFRAFMKESLEEQYRIFEAADGKEGLEGIYKNIPDIIISDVMMPGMDGLELCKSIKNDPRTSHIPIVLLTARTADEDKIKGLEIGADDYITKPFNMDFLLIRIQNLIDRQKNAHDRFGKKMEINPSEIEISSIDEKLIRKAIKLVEDNISENKFSVEDLSHELGMSRVYLYKKLRTITGKTPIEFIRIIRLKRGSDLLVKSQMTISEVAYEVGFNNPRYFSKYFEKEFGVLPSKYIESYGKKP